MTDFREKLKEIRATEQERMRHRVPLTDHSSGSTSRDPSLRGPRPSGEGPEQMLADLSPRPHLRDGPRRFEGKYALSISYDEPFLDEARGLGHFSRIASSSIRARPTAFAMTAKITVRDRTSKASDTGNLDLQRTWPG
jgi:hypothetical protein